MLRAVPWMATARRNFPVNSLLFPCSALGRLMESSISHCKICNFLQSNREWCREKRKNSLFRRNNREFAFLLAFWGWFQDKIPMFYKALSHNSLLSDNREFPLDNRENSCTNREMRSFGDMKQPGRYKERRPPAQCRTAGRV